MSGELESFTNEIPPAEIFMKGMGNLYTYFALNDDRMRESRGGYIHQHYWRENHPFANEVLGWLGRDYPQLYELAVRSAADSFDHTIKKPKNFEGSLGMLMGHIMWIFLNKSSFNRNDLMSLRA